LPTSGCADWMLNSYSKYCEPSQEDIDWYFKNKSKNKDLTTKGFTR
jgi:hypothetical protein